MAPALEQRDLAVERSANLILRQQLRKLQHLNDDLVDALERIAHYPFDVMSDAEADLRAIKQIAHDALPGVQA